MLRSSHIIRPRQLNIHAGQSMVCHNILTRGQVKMNKSIAMKLAFWTIAFFVKEAVVARSASDDSVIINANTIQSFFNNEAPLLIDETHIAGMMVVSAVHNNRVVFKKGTDTPTSNKNNASMQTTHSLELDQYQSSSPGLQYSSC